MKRKNLLFISSVVICMIFVFMISAFATTSEATASLKIVSNTLELQNAVFMNFKVDSENISDKSSIKLLVWEEAPAEYDKTTADATLSPIRTESDTGYLVFQYNNLSAKEMTRFIYVCAYADVNGEEVYSKSVKFSVLQYAYNVINSEFSSEGLKKLATDMLQYGATAQSFFGYNTDFLATDEVAKVKVVNGTHTDGFKTGYYKAGTSVTLTANAAEEGYIFSHWEDSLGNVVGFESTLIISECTSETYTAMYRNATSSIQYRYRDKQYTTSTTELEEPWILYDTITETEHGATVKVYLKEDETIDTDVYCIHYKTSVCKYMHPTNSTYKWVSSSSSNHNYYYTYGDTKYWHYDDYYCYSCCHVSAKTTSTEYYYYSWSEWSEWSDTPITSTDSREVEVRGVFTITYDANGGTNAPVAQSKALGESIIITSSAPTRDGYTFKGWSTTKNGTVEYTAGDTYSEDSSITFYAVWEANTYTITYNANGGENAPDTQTKTHGIDLTLSSVAPTREGYTFKGWATTVNGTVAYNEGDTYSINESATLHAVWNINTYTITYNANGGENAPEVQTKTHGIDLTLSSVVPTRDGYTFKGWATTVNGTVAYNKGDTYSINESATLHAVWNINTYTITYNANGGENTPEVQTKTHGIDLTLSSVAPTRDGYTFKGWATTVNGAIVYNAGNTYSVNDNITLYAIWEVDAQTTYTLVYDANGGIGAPKSVTQEKGLSVPISNNIPTREGFTFLGWSTHPAGSMYSTTDNGLGIVSNWTENSNGIGSYTVDDSYCGNKDIILYAVWQVNSSNNLGNKCGDNLYWSYDSSTYTLTITGFGTMYNFIKAPWSTYATKIKNVDLPEGLLSIGNNAFNYCPIKNLNLPSTVVSIGSRAFSNNALMSELTIASTVKQICFEAFKNCDYLISVNIECGGLIDIDTFNSCDRLKNITISGNVTRILSRAFADCNTGLAIYFELPNSLTWLTVNAIRNTAGTYIYYRGSENEWSNLSQNKFNNVSIYFYSEVKPAYTGNYWHYDENGDPVIWRF